MATSNTAKRTKFKTADGLRIYDLSPLTMDIFAVAGPDWKDPRSIDCEDLPEGFRWITNEEWEKAIQTEVPDEFVFAHNDQQWLHSAWLYDFTGDVLRKCKATEEEINELCDGGFSGFEDLMVDLQCDLCHFLEDRGYVVILEDSPSGFQRCGPISSKLITESDKMQLFHDASRYAKNASYPHYFERAGKVLEKLRAEKEKEQADDRLALLDEAVELLRGAKEYLRTTIPSRDRTMLSSGIQKFLAKVAKN